MKLVYALMTAFAIELSLYVFGGMDMAKTSIFGILFNPSTIASSVLWLLILASVALVGVAIFLPGLFAQLNPYALYAIVMGSLLPLVVSIVHLYQWTFSELASILPSCSVSSCPMGQLIAIIICSPFLLYYIIACLEWIRGNQ
jgi:hypothetical protein